MGPLPSPVAEPTPPSTAPALPPQRVDAAGAYPVVMERSLYLGKDIPLGGTAHQAGTARFGSDPSTSVLNPDCRAHGVQNLYLTDASFFPSIGAVNPTLTIIANALRLAVIIKARLGVTAA